MNNFKELGLSPDILKAIKDLDYAEPSPIQRQTIPFILKSNNDLVALAQTGTGKTAAFSLPILEKLDGRNYGIQAIILCPTRELCIQISRDISSFGKYMEGFRVASVYGGERIDLQIRSLRNNPAIVVGTPGRVHDLIRRKALKIQTIKWLVLDEADEMLDMGFKDDLDAILEQTPESRQTLLFSATISKSVQAIARNYMNDAEEISVGKKNIGAEKVTHEYYVVQARDRFEALKRILDYIPGVYGILFCRTRQEAKDVADKLKLSQYNTEALHGDIAQNMRTRIMDRFKAKQINLLVATDVAARGIDVNDLSHVINYNLPDQDEAYTHRSGRTGRAQKSGVAISIVSPRELGRIRKLEQSIGKTFECKPVPTGENICQKQIESFIAKVENSEISDVGHDKYLLEIIEKLKKIHKDDLIKFIVSHQVGHIFDSYKNVRDLNCEFKKSERREREVDGVNLRISMGKKQGFDIKSLFGLINSNKKTKGTDIGRINLDATCTIFSVDKQAADNVLRSLSGGVFRGKKFFIDKIGHEAGGISKKRKRRR